MDQISDNFSKHYSGAFKKFGPSAKGVDWKDKKQADLRYRAMLNVIKSEDKDSKKKISVLDVGCGYGQQYLFAKKNGYKISFTGIDIVPEMISYAKKTIKDADFFNIDVFNYKPKKLFDYVICNGVLTQKLEASDSKMDIFANKLISKMFKLAKKGIVFNTMSTYVDFKTKGNYYNDPAKILKKCLKLTRFVKIDHSYPLYEYSVYMYKDKI